MGCCILFFFLITQRVSSAGDDHNATNNGTDTTINETIEIDKENKSLLQVNIKYMFNVKVLKVPNHVLF